MVEDTYRLAEKYTTDLSFEDRQEEIRDKYQKYTDQKEENLLEALGTAAAVESVFRGEGIDQSEITPEMREAFNLKYPNQSIEELADLQPEQIQGYINGWKGKYFEVLVNEKLNNGEMVGDIALEYGQTAELAETGQEGFDLVIRNADGGIAEELQLKASEELGIAKEALEKYPDIDILGTEEMGQEDTLDQVIGSQIEDEQIEASIEEPLDDLLGGPEELAEDLLAGLPFLIIAGTEGHKYFVGKSDFNEGLTSSLQRSLKSAAAIGVGSLFVLMNLGLVSLPASFFTRIGFDRVIVTRTICDRIEQKTAKLRMHV